MHVKAFGRNLKLGVIEDAGSRDQLAPLLRFPTSKSGEDMTSLSDYVSRCERGRSQAHGENIRPQHWERSMPGIERVRFKVMVGTLFTV
jgi:molecular chaperone HtpG